MKTTTSLDSLISSTPRLEFYLWYVNAKFITSKIICLLYPSITLSLSLASSPLSLLSGREGVLARAAITGYLRPGGLVSGESSLVSLQMAPSCCEVSHVDFGEIFLL